jgi:D-glycero-D-manno-heptose 1,7-bisphosphate phosphatase
VTWDTIRQVEDEIQATLRPRGADVTAFYYCPHGLEDGCDCRKPAPGLLLRAASDLGIDLAASVIIGDSESDVQAGKAAGCSTILIAPPGTGSAADVVAPDLGAAARVVLDG